MLTNLATPESLDAQVTVAKQAFAIMAEMNVFAAAAPSDPTLSELESGPTFAALIGYIGECQGTLRIDCSPSIAFAFTERICGIDPPLEFNSDVSDAIGELINTIGGNLKGLLPPHTRLNIPKVFMLLPGEAKPLSGPALSCLNFVSEFGAFRLVLLETV
jgi:chemotaxis protein CheX